MSASGLYEVWVAGADRENDEPVSVEDTLDDAIGVAENMAMHGIEAEIDAP